MKRTTKNIIMILLIPILIGSMYFTMNYAKNNISANKDWNNQKNVMAPPDNSIEKNGAEPPAKPDEESTNEENDSSKTESEKTKKANPSKFNKEDSQKSDNNEKENNSELNKPEKPSESSKEVTEDNKPEKSNDENNKMTPPDKSEIGNMPPDMNNTSSKINLVYYIAFGVESLVLSVVIVYLILSKFNKKTFKETFENNNKKIIALLSTILLTGGLTYLNGYLTNNYFIKNNNKDIKEITANNTVEATASKEVDGKEETLSDTYEATASDESAIIVKNGGKATINKATINKKSGDSSNTESSEFYGVNSGVLVTKKSSATIKNSKISTKAKGSNAVFSTGEDSKIYISDSTISTTGSSSARGLDATYGGYIEADNVDITTEGNSCASLATDRGEGTVIANNSNLETNGSGSPLIYSTGDISIDNTKGTANGSQLVVIEGKNKATITNSDIEASGTGNRGDVDQAGVMIYQSMSGDANEGTGTLEVKNSTLSIQENSEVYKTAPMFFITNTDAIINLENTKLNFGSNLLVSIKGTDEWGTSGKNGGNLTLNATKQTLSGNIEVDNISTLTLNLNSSTYKGSINTDNTAKILHLV